MVRGVEEEGGDKGEEGRDDECRQEGLEAGWRAGGLEACLEELEAGVVQKEEAEEPGEKVERPGKDGEDAIK
jgi:hypothetical protein